MGKATKLPPEAARYREAIRAELSTMDTRDAAQIPYAACALADAVRDLYANLANRSPEAAGKRR